MEEAQPNTQWAWSLLFPVGVIHGLAVPHIPGSFFPVFQIDLLDALQVLVCACVLTCVCTHVDIHVMSSSHLWIQLRSRSSSYFQTGSFIET